MKTVCIGLLAALCISASALEVPKLTGHVNDYGNFLTPVEEQQLEQQLKDHEKDTSNQIVILTLESLKEESLEQFSLNVAERWKLGQKGKDNGILILLVKDKHDIRIETGYGMEGPVPDAICKRIINQEMIPLFKDGKFKEGLSNAIQKILLAVKGEYKAEIPAREIGGKGWEVILFAFIILAGLAGFIHWAIGGIVGAAFGFFLGFWLKGMPLAIVLAVVGFLLGSIARFILEGMANSRGGSWSSGGGRSSGGYSGGGGSFGGGGASGRW